MFDLLDKIQEPAYVKPYIKSATDWFDARPNMSKVAFVIDHWFRAACMASFMYIMPASKPVNFVICAASSILYRVTVEEANCTLRFALASSAGAAAFMLSKDTLVSFVNTFSFKAFKSFSHSLVLVTPITIYVFCTIRWAYKGVNAKTQQKPDVSGDSCCQSNQPAKTEETGVSSG